MLKAVFGPAALAIILFISLCLPGCGKSEAAASADAPAKPVGGQITGKVTFADGKTIDTPGADISISISGVSSAGEKVNYSPAIKPDGTYSQKVVPGSYAFGVLNSITVQFDGKSAQFRLEPVGNLWNKDRDVDQGIVQDYVWKITGKVAGSDGDINNHTDWHGVSITPLFQSYRSDTHASALPVPDGAKIVFTLKPTGPRVDGHPAETQTVERVWRAKDLTQIDNLNDLPPADYDVSGAIHFPDGSTKPIVFDAKIGEPYQPTWSVRFAPGAAGGLWPAQVGWAFN
ncbi:MAG: hypothetical protein JWM57_1809 [Phycisphaerales bacterium]|nr:hypothetical protein [Phycisphaerales bacterium]